MPRSFSIRSLATPLALAVPLALPVVLCGTLFAQGDKTITIVLLDGKTGTPVTPSNLIVRLDHLNAIHSENLKINDDGTGEVIVPPKSTFLSVQGTYSSSMEIYVNCDAGMQKDTSTLHWYSIADILSSGIAMPNECYKAKYAEATKVTPKPGQFILFVRKTGWRETTSDF